MFKIAANFIGDFKLGDNINFNLKVLFLLYKYFEEGNEQEKNLLCKPITIILISIIEAILHDLHYRIKVFTLEGVPYLAEEIICYIRGKKIDELEKYISSARKHNMLKSNDASIYEQLDNLRKLRNRIHIQNTKKNFEPNDDIAFSKNRKIIAEKILENILITLNSEYPRKINVSSYVNDFELPWTQHFNTRKSIDNTLTDEEILTLEEAEELDLI